MTDPRPFRPVPLPVDITDAERFPETALALAHARRMRIIEALRNPTPIEEKP